MIALCTKGYQASPYCQIELKYANDLEIPILPIICDKSYTEQQKGTSLEDRDPAKWPSSWLGALIGGKFRVDFRDDADPDCFEAVKNKIVEIKSSIPIRRPVKDSFIEVASRDVDELRKIEDIMNGAIKRITVLRENKQSIVHGTDFLQKSNIGTQDGEDHSTTTSSPPSSPAPERRTTAQPGGVDVTTTVEPERTPTDGLKRTTTVVDETGRKIFLKSCYDGNTEIVKYLAVKYPDLINSA